MSRGVPRWVFGAVATAALAASTSTLAGPAAAADRNSARTALLARADGHGKLTRGQAGGSTFFGTTPGHPARHPDEIRPSDAPAEAARVWLEKFGSAFGIDHARDVRVERTTPLPHGGSIVRLRQTIGGLPVVAGDVVMTLTSQHDLVTLNGHLMPDVEVPAVAGISAVTAGGLAERVVQRSTRAGGLHISAPVLSLLDPAMIGGAPETTGPRTVWATTVTSANRLVRHQVFVNAADGDIVLDLDDNRHANRVVCQPIDGPDTAADDPRCSGADDNPDVQVVASESAPPVLDPNAPGYDADTANAFRFAGAVDDFYSSLLGRDSVDGKGKALNSTVHYCFPPSQYDPNPTCPMDNAFWDGNEMVYGSGYAAALDVVGHEFTHGVTQHTSKLFSYYQSGAIDESISDVMGELIQQIEGPSLNAAGQTDVYDPNKRWLLGEKLASVGVPVVRNMENPPALGDPDRMTSTYYSAYNPWQARFDGGGVHANAGVGNKAAFLMAGGPNGSGTQFSFPGIGIGVTGAVKIANIYYRLQLLMGSGTSYADLYNLLPAACDQLVAEATTIALPGGTHTFMQQSDCDQVRLAVSAVEMNRQPLKSVARVPAAAPYCTNGGGATTKRLDLFESNPFKADLYDRGHPRGTIGDWWWSKTKIAYYNNNAAPAYQRPGSTASLWGDDADPYAFSAKLLYGDHQDSRVSTVRRIKAAAGTFVRFEHAWEFDYAPVFDTAGRPISRALYYDGGRVEYSVDGGRKWYDAAAKSAVAGKPLFANGGPNGRLDNTDGLFGNRYVDPNPLKGRRAFVGSSHGWTSSRLDLGPLKGKSVLLRWRVATDDAVGSIGWYVDNVRSYSCNPTTISLKAPTSVKKGSIATLRAHLVRSGTTSVLVGKPVQLWQRKHGTSTWNKVGSPKNTNSNGNVTWSPKPTVKTDYRVRFPGQLPLAPSNYASRTVAVT